MKDHLVKVEKKKYLTRDIVELWVRLLKPSSIRFQAGQFMFFKISGAFKAYTITSLPEDKKTLRFLIRLVENGKGSAFIKNLQVGQEFEMTGPEGWFTLRSRPKNLCFVAGGVGLAPFLSILGNLSRTGKNINGSLLYFCGQGERHVYEQELQFFARNVGNFQVCFLSGQRVEKYLKQHYSDHKRLVYFLCGSDAFVDAAEQTLLALGHAQERIRTERFLK